MEKQKSYGLEERALLKTGLFHLEQIEDMYLSLGLPSEYKPNFLNLLIYSIHGVFELESEQWTRQQYDVWKRILGLYERDNNFEEVKKGVDSMIEEIEEADKVAGVIEEHDRRRYENG